MWITSIGSIDLEPGPPRLIHPLSISWTDEAEAPPPAWWSGVEPAWQAPELALEEDWVLVLDGDPEPGDEWPVYPSD